MPTEVAKLLLINLSNLHDVLDQIKEMLHDKDGILSAKVQDEFTRLQVFSVEYLEKHYAYLVAFYGQFRQQLKKFEKAKL
jgi:hypothetical protein